MFTEDWFGPASCEALTELVGRTAGLPGKVVEIGSWEGRSTVALANAINPDMVHAVDTWQGSPGEISADLAAERDVLGTFLDNIKELTAGNVHVHHQGWRDYFATHSDPCRFVFIDAAHTYEEVRDNIDMVYPLIVRGGIVCGDDVHHLPIQQAVVEAFPRAQVTATLWFACL